MAASLPPAGAAGTQLAHSTSPPTVPARGRRQGVRGSFLPHPTSSSLGGMDEKQQSPKLYFRTGTWGGNTGGGCCSFTGSRVASCCNAVFLQQRTETHPTFNFLSRCKVGLLLCFLFCPAPFCYPKPAFKIFWYYGNPGQEIKS